MDYRVGVVEDGRLAASSLVFTVRVYNSEYALVQTLSEATITKIAIPIKGGVRIVAQYVPQEVSRRLHYQAA